MAARGGGSIINMASAAIDLAVPNYGLYALPKAAVTQLSQTFAVEVGAQGIRVNVLAPGATLTNFTNRHLKNPDGSINPGRYDGFVAARRSLECPGPYLDIEPKRTLKFLSTWNRLCVLCIEP